MRKNFFTLNLFFYILLIALSGCSKNDEDYQDIEDVNSANAVYGKSRLSINEIREQVEGRFETLKDKHLLWEYAYDYQYSDDISATVIPIEITQDNQYEVLAVSNIKGASDMGLVTFVSESINFTPEIYPISPYQIIKEKDFKGKVKYTQFKAFSFGGMEDNRCNACHKDGGSPTGPGSGGSPFPDETLPEIVIDVPGWDWYNPWGPSDPGNVGGVIFHPGQTQPNNPCANLDQDIKNNIDALNDYINQLAANVNSVPRVEKGFTIDANGNYNSFAGTSNSPQIPLSLQGQYNALVHTHYYGLLQGPSPEDLMTLYNLAIGGHLSNYQDFTFGIVTSDGYIGVHIDNYQDFMNAFGNMNGQTLSDHYFDYNLINKFGRPVTSNSSIGQFTSLLNNLLAKLNSGLSLSYRKKNQSGNDQWYYYDKATKTMKQC